MNTILKEERNKINMSTESIIKEFQKKFGIITDIFGNKINGKVEAHFLQALSKVREETKKEIARKLDSIIYAHLWGDYSRNLDEIYDGCEKLLLSLKEGSRKLNK